MPDRRSARWGTSRWDALRWAGSAMSVTAADLMAAVVAFLRSHPEVVAALEEDTTRPGGTKIWADNQAFEQPDPPYLTYSEPDEKLTAESPHDDNSVHYQGPGSFILTVIDIDKLRCRQTAQLIVSALNDAPLSFADGELLELRWDGVSARPVTLISPGSPTTYQRSLTFHYVVERVF